MNPAGRQHGMYDEAGDTSEEILANRLALVGRQC
jgi:hypothetical protein